MSAVSSPSRQMSWQPGRPRVSVLAALAIHKETVSQRLTKLREDNRQEDGDPLPQERAAQRVGVSVRQWQRWEAGVSTPYPRNLGAIADTFGFDVGEFYDDEPVNGKRQAPSQLDRIERGLQRNREMLLRIGATLEGSTPEEFAQEFESHEDREGRDDEEEPPEHGAG